MNHDELHEAALRAIGHALDPSSMPKSDDGEVFLTLAQLVERMPPTDEERLRRAARRWLRAVDRALGERARVEVLDDEDAWEEADWWREVFKPWLCQLVGWSALSEIGRAADEEGYRLLANHFARKWREHYERAEADGYLEAMRSQPDDDGRP